MNYFKELSLKNLKEILIKFIEKDIFTRTIAFTFTTCYSYFSPSISSLPSLLLSLLLISL